VPDHTVVQEAVEVALNGYLQLSLDLSGLDIHLCSVVVGAAR
jgi:hypothetical protein